MTSAIARWHSSARPPSDALEQAYADQLEAEMQEMAIQLHKVTTEEKLNVAAIQIFIISELSRLNLKLFTHIHPTNSTRAAL